MNNIIKNAEREIFEKTNYTVRLLPIFQEDNGIDITKEQIMEAVVKATGLSFKDIISKKRDTPIMDARKLICYILYNLCSMTLKDIALFLKFKTHDRVFVMKKEAVNLLEVNPAFVGKYKKILKELSINY